MQPEQGQGHEPLEAPQDNSVDNLLPGQAADGEAPGGFKFNLIDRSADPDLVLTDFLEALASVTTIPVSDLRSLVEHNRVYGLRPARALLMSQVVSGSEFDAAERRKRDSVRLTPEMVDWDIAGLLPQQFCQHAGIIAYQKDDSGQALVAHSDQLDKYAQEVIAEGLGNDYKTVWAERQAIGSCWQLRPLDSSDGGDDAAAAIARNPLAIWNDLTSQTGGFMSDSTGLQLSYMFVHAAVKGASDIHIEGTATGEVEVRYRSLGRMRLLMQWPLALGEQIVNRLRVVAKVKDNPDALADARFAVLVPQHGVFNVRLSFCPTYVGQMVTMRMLSARAGAEQSLKDVWLAEHSPPNRPPMAERIEDLLASRSDGLVLVVGRTGDGKTTTLAAMLSEFCKPGDRKVLTAEHPVEYAIPGAQQVDITEWYGEGPPPEGYKTWGNVLRAFLRCDPDVIMIGEIRDEETARIAIRAAQTGHVVLATIHVRDAASAPSRLVDMAPGTEKMLSESLNGVLAQRLIRTVCVACRGHMSADCAKCGGEGFDAQTAVGEMLVVDEAVREAIAQKESPAHLVRAAMKDQTQVADALAHLIRLNLTTEAEAAWSFGREVSAQAAERAASPEPATGDQQKGEQAA